MQTYSLSRLATLLRCDRKTIQRVLGATPPEGKGDQGDPEWSFETAKRLHAEYLRDKGGAVGLKDKKLAEEIRRLSLYNDTKEGKVTPTAWTSSLLVRMAAAIRACHQRMENECPVMWAGLTTAAIRGEMRAYHDRLDAELQRLGAEIISDHPDPTPEAEA